MFQSKKIWFTFVSLLVIMLLVAGCGATNEAGSDQPSGEADENTGAEGETEETRMIEHFMGETEIPVNPERIIALSYTGQVIALGVKPVGVLTNMLDDVYLQDHLQGVEDIGNEVNLEKILELNPDVIIASDSEEKSYDQLTKIAPTILIPWMEQDVNGHLNSVAEILGKEKEAEEWLAAFDKKAAEGQEKIEEAIGEDTVAIYRIRKGRFQIYGPRNIGHALYNALELNPPKLVKEAIENDGKFHSNEISLEVLPEYSADHIFVMVEDEEETKKQFEEIQSSAIWSNLPAVKNGNVYFVGKQEWLPYDSVSVEGQLDMAVELLKK
jgi:iron complex transport system substrate-binding protein